MAKKITDKQIKDLREHFEKTPISVRALADKSEQICGRKISYASVSRYSQEQQWQKKPEKKLNKTDENVRKIADIVAESIIADWDENGTVDSQKVNAYMNLVTKLGVEITQTGTSKSEIQMVLEGLT